MAQIILPPGAPVSKETGALSRLRGMVLMDVQNKEYLNIESGVLIPALQSVINGLFYSLASVALVGIANYQGVLDVPLWASWALSFALFGLMKWRELLNDWRCLLYGVEDIEPGPQVLEPVRVELASDNGRSMQYINLPAKPQQLQQLGTGLIQGASFSESRWIGAGAPFSRSEFVRLRDELIRRGLAQWNSDRNAARGASITAKGRAVFRYLSEVEYPPTLKRKG